MLWFFVPINAQTLIAQLASGRIVFNNVEQATFDKKNDNILQVVIAAEMNDIVQPKNGMYAQLKTLIDRERKNSPTTFFLFGGGSIGPSAFSNLDRGSHIIDLLNSLEPDAMGVSKREFSYNVEELSLRSYEAAFPIVASNTIDTRSNKTPDGLVSSAIISRNNIKLGFISIANQRLIQEYLLSDIAVEDPTAAVITRAKELRSKNVDLIILHYFNLFPNIDELLNKQVINYAFNSNTRLREEDKKALIDNKNNFFLDLPGQAIVARFENAKHFPLISVHKQDLSELPPEAYVENQVNGYLTRLNRLLDDNIAYWADTFSTRREDVRGRENAFANYVTDAMREFGNSDIAIINSGSIRGDRIYNKGEQITRRTIATELPFRSTITTLSITGEQLIEALEVGLAGLDMLKGAFAQVSGMTLVYDSTKPQWQRVVSVQIGGKPLDKSKTYLLTTTDYLAEGGDGYTSFTAAKKPIDATTANTILTYDLVLRTLGVHGKLESQIEARIIDIASKS